MTGTGAATTCSGLVRSLGVDPAGSASAMRSWLLLEHRAPWGEDARERAYRAALGDAGWARLQRIWQAEQLRPLLARRPGRPSRQEPPALILGAARDGRHWLERLPAASLPALDLEALAAGQAGHGEPLDGPLFAVCTNGSVDRCCAVRGRPLAAALAAAHPERTWEVSHVGGCHFAANLLVLPDGVLHGNVTPEAGLRIAAAARQGEVEPALMRGRTTDSGHPTGTGFAAAAEVALRRRLRLPALDALAVVHEQPHADVVRDDAVPQPAGADVLLRAGDRTWRVVVRRRDLSGLTSVCEPAQVVTTADVTALVPVDVPAARADAPVRAPTGQCD